MLAIPSGWPFVAFIAYVTVSMLMVNHLVLALGTAAALGVRKQAPA